jgi:hypothetical protein
MQFSRIDLRKTNYQVLQNFKILREFNFKELDSIYTEYCRYKQYQSVMPLFPSELIDPKTDILGYYHNSDLVAFSYMKRYDNESVEAVQFAWNYKEPKLRLGIHSLQSECAYYKRLGFTYLYLGFADEYKKQIDGFEIVGPR